MSGNFGLYNEVDLQDLQVQEKEILQRRSGLRELSVLFEQSRALELTIQAGHYTKVTVKVNNAWEEYTVLAKVVRDLLSKADQEINLFYSTVISKRGTTVGTALDFAKYHVEVKNASKEEVKSDKKAGSKSSK